MSRKRRRSLKITNPLLLKLFPFLAWFGDMNSKSLKADLIAGVTVSLVLIPQSLAYAELAGLPAHYGLYAAFFPPMVAALFGSSRHLSTGPTGIVSLMTATAIGSLALTGSPEFIAYTTLLALGLGLFQLVIGTFRLGSLISFVSHPVIYGFTNAAAIIIALTQLGTFLGVSVESRQHQYQTVVAVMHAAIENTHLPTLIMGITALVVMYVLKKLSPRIPAILIVLVAATIISWQIGYQVTFNGSIFNIASENLVDKISQYDTDLVILSSKHAEVQELEKQLDNEFLTDVERYEIDNKYRIALFEKRRLEEEIKLFRSELRSTKLYNVDPLTPSFYPIDEVSGIPPASHIWKLKVGNGKLLFNSLTFLQGGATVGHVPGGLPSFAIPPIDVSKLLSLLPMILIMAIIGFTEAVSVAQAIAVKTKQHIDPNQELIGQGVANIVGSFSRSYPVAGSFSRTAINYQSGAVTGFASVITGSMVLLTLLLFTPLLVYLPQVVLAAVIVVSVIGLIDFKRIVQIWKSNYWDGVTAVLTFVSTLYFAPDLEKGVAVGVGFSLIYYLYHNARPRIVFLSKYRDGTFHDSELFHLARCSNIAMIRFDAPLFFTNAENLENAIINDLAHHKKIRSILIVGSGIDDIDATGAEVLRQLIEILSSSKRQLYISSLRTPVREVLEVTGLIESIGEDHIFNSQKEAVRHILKTIKKHDDHGNCPLEKYVTMHREEALTARNLRTIAEGFHDLLLGGDKKGE